MPASFERISFADDSSFTIGVFQDNLEKCTWHYHDSYELSFVTEGSGKRIVADSMVEFQPGDLVFIGRRLPHVWIADKEYSTPYGRTLEMVSIQFKELVIPNSLLVLSEFQHIVKAVDRAAKGIQITGDTLNDVSNIMLQLPYKKGIDRLLDFYRMLDIIGNSVTNVSLASNDYLKKRFVSGDKRVAKIHEYLMNHYQEEIDLKKLAELVNMAEGSLCRFFKANVGLTVFEYLNQVKIDFACKLLMDQELTVLQVCLDSGFNNLSHFNKQFKKNTGTTPLEYRKQFKGLLP